MPAGPYSQDVLTRIINVQWGGLAVIFGAMDEDAPDQPAQRDRTMSEPSDV